MEDALVLWEKPTETDMIMLAGWRQWADAGSTSSLLPKYLVEQTNARKIGEIRPTGFYLFQIPGTHDLVRPMIRFEEGHPVELDTPTNEIFYTTIGSRGLVIFLGDEPHLDIERYVEAFLSIAKTLNVRRIVGFGGVYGELPYNKERMVAGIYSLPRLKSEMRDLALNLSNYQGGASIGSYTCKRAGEQEIEFVAMYAFVPTYDFSGNQQIGNSIRLENDFMAWLGIMRRVNYMLHTGIDLTDLENKSKLLVKFMDTKVDELDQKAPEKGVREYMRRLSEEFTETPFDPLDNVWEDELRRLFDKFEGEEPNQDE